MDDPEIVQLFQDSLTNLGYKIDSTCLKELKSWYKLAKDNPRIDSKPKQDSQEEIPPAPAPAGKTDSLEDLMTDPAAFQAKFDSMVAETFHYSDDHLFDIVPIGGDD